MDEPAMIFLCQQGCLIDKLANGRTTFFQAHLKKKCDSQVIIHDFHKIDCGTTMIVVPRKSNYERQVPHAFRIL